MVIAGGGTGGHLYPALNLADALERREEGAIHVLLVGARRGVEARVLPERGVPHRLLPLEPIYRSRPWRNWRLLASAVAVTQELREVFAEFSPHLVVGTGGYAAGPVVAWARMSGTPTALQEANSYPGLTTRWLAPYVDQLHLGYREALAHLQPGPDTEVEVHGNPIRWPAERPDPSAVRRDLALGEGRVVLVVGGSQGSAPLNETILDALSAVATGELPPAPDDVWILWAAGPAHREGVETRLRELDLPRVRVVPYIAEMERALSVTDLAVSRAGALMLSELCAWGVPSLLVPLPHAAAGHQTKNARSLAKTGAAIALAEEKVRERPADLWMPLLDLLKDTKRLERMAAAARRRGNPRAADQIAADLWRLMEAA